MKVNRVWLGWALIATLLVFGVLILVAWDFVREAIVIPLAYLIWLSGLILKSIPQGVYLILLVMICFFIALNTFSKLSPRRPNYRSIREARGDAARYRLWLKLCATSYASEYSRLELAHETRKLILSVLAYQEGLNLSEVERKIVSGDLAVPVTIRRLIRERDFLPVPQPKPRFWQRFVRKAEGQTDPLLDSALKEIVHFIEDRLEIVHDGNRLSSQN